MQPHFVIIESRVYPEIMDSAYYSVVSQLNNNGISSSRITVPQLLDMPTFFRIVGSASRNNPQDNHSQNLKEPSCFLFLGVHTGNDTNPLCFSLTIQTINQISQSLGFEVGFGMIYEDSLDFFKTNRGISKINFTTQLAVQSCLSMLKLKQQLSYGK
jgi:hypothetical protein